MTIGRRALDRETRARDAMDAMDARSIVRAIVRDPSRSVDVERPSRDDGAHSDISKSSRKRRGNLNARFFAPFSGRV